MTHLHENLWLPAEIEFLLPRNHKSSFIYSNLYLWSVFDPLSMFWSHFGKVQTQQRACYHWENGDCTKPRVALLIIAKSPSSQRGQVTTLTCRACLLFSPPLSLFSVFSVCFCVHYWHIKPRWGGLLYSAPVKWQWLCSREERKLHLRFRVQWLGSVYARISL